MCLFEVCSKWFKQTRVCNAVPLVWGLSGLPQLQCCYDFSQSATYISLYIDKKTTFGNVPSIWFILRSLQKENSLVVYTNVSSLLLLSKVDIVYTRAMWMHVGEPLGSKVLRYFAHVTVACVTLHMSAFCHCYLQESSTAQWGCCTRRYKCSNTVGGSNDESLTEVVPTLQPFVIAASRNHSLLNSVATFLTSSSPHPYPHPLGEPLLSASNSISTSWSCMCTTVVAFLCVPL